MKIEKKVEDCMNFDEVRCGDMFRAENGCYYMKLLSTDYYNAVNLVTGETVRFNNYAPVIPMPNAKIVI